MSKAIIRSLLKISIAPILAIGLVSILGCKNQNSTNPGVELSSMDKGAVFPYDSSTSTIHLIVALCDNKYQGIVPVPESIGNGQDPNNNLYWGTAYGIRTYFDRSDEWKRTYKSSGEGVILERIVYKHHSKNFYLVADAYDGQHIRQATTDLLNSLAGKTKDTLNVDGTTIGLMGNAKMVSYIGHDGLMDFNLPPIFRNKDDQKRDAIILACYSQSYFTDHLKDAKATPLLWTTGLMAPEAYTLHDALRSYINGGSGEDIHLAGASAYHRYQKCGLNAAKRLFVTGF